MKAIKLLLFPLALVIACYLTAFAQNSSAPANATATGAAAKAPAEVPAKVAAPIEKRLETFFGNVFALGPGAQIHAGPITNSQEPDFYEVPIKVTVAGQSSTGTVFVSKDGRYMFRGELQDLNADPLAEIRRQIHLEGYASKGPANAKVTVVEYGDLECPSCRQFESGLRTVLPKYPQVRFVFKDFPLEQLHPWAKTAALAAHCVLRQSVDAFWKFHDAIYDNQNLITVDNAYDKLGEYAAQAGADPAAYKACIIDPAIAELVARSQDEGRSLGVTGTPTTFVDGRRIAGPDAGILEQYIEFDLKTGVASR